MNIWRETGKNRSQFFQRSNLKQGIILELKMVDLTFFVFFPILFYYIFHLFVFLDLELGLSMVLHVTVTNYHTTCHSVIHLLHVTSHSVIHLLHVTSHSVIHLLHVTSHSVIHLLHVTSHCHTIKYYRRIQKVPE